MGIQRTFLTVASTRSSAGTWLRMHPRPSSLAPMRRCAESFVAGLAAGEDEFGFLRLGDLGSPSTCFT